MAMNPRLLRPTASGFNPKSIAGLNLWIDFADTSKVILDGNNKIQDVLDKSGLGQNGTQATSGNRLAVSTINGRQCANNGTSSNSFRVAYTTGATNNNWRDLYVAAIWDAGGSVFPADAYSSFFSGSNSTGTITGTGVIADSNVNQFFASTNHSGSGSLVAINNTVKPQDTAVSLLPPFPSITSAFVFRGSSAADIGIDGWQIGNDRAFAGRGWRGRIGEVISFNRRLSLSESLRVRRYLANKWGAPAQT